MDKKNLNADELENISGGKVVAVTPYGSQLMDNGSVMFRDKNGKGAILTAVQWKELNDYYAYTGNPEKYFKDVPIDDLIASGVIKGAVQKA